MDLKSLIIGGTFGAGVVFFTGFLKHAGEDCYRWSRGLIFPFKEEKKTQVIVQMSGNSDQVSHDALNTTPVEEVSDITFDALKKSISESPPLQRPDVAKRYVGMKVAWKAYLASAHQLEGDQVRLHLSIDPTGPIGISCSVTAEDYPRLRVLDEGAALRVSGTIQECSAYDVVLSEARIQFLKE